MWRYNDSDLEPASAYCNYCGQTCASRRHLKNGLGVCNRCSRVLSHLTDSTNNSRTMSPQETSSVATIEDMDETRSDGTESLSDLSEIEEQEEQEEEEEEEEAGGQDENEVALCPRCWKKPPTTKLYDVPICQGCLQQANEQKELPPGSRKRRFQPPTPALAPGKKLTRVCDTCRKRRKRCPHRRVVNADDPEADPRSKRIKAAVKKSDDEEEEEESEATLTPALESTPMKSSEESEESIEEADEDADEVANEADDEEDDEEDAEEVDEDVDEKAEESPCPSQTTKGAHAQSFNDHDCDEVMKGAIRDSIENVLGKEAQDLISSVQEKLDQASQELTKAKKDIGKLMSQRGRKRK